MATAKAVIEASMDGTQVKAEASAIDGAFNKLGGTLSNQLGGALRTVSGSIAGVVRGGLSAAGVLHTLNISRGVNDAKELDAITARLGKTLGQSGEALKNQFKGMEARTHATADAQAEFVGNLTLLTSNAKGSSAALLGLADHALATGQTLGEQLDLGHLLVNGLGAVSGTSEELGRLRSMAETLGTVGGPEQLLKTFKAIESQLGQVSMETDEARAKTTAWIGVATKGLKPEQQARVGAGMIEFFKSKALDMERVTGTRVYDKNGNLDLDKAIRTYKGYMAKKFGKNDAQRRRVILMSAGLEVGSAIERAQASEVDAVAGTSQDKGDITASAKDFRHSKVGRRERVENQQNATDRSIGGAFVAVQDALIDKVGSDATTRINIAAGALATLGIGSAVAGLVKGGLPAIKGAGEALGVAALPLTAMATVGYLGYQDIMSTETDYQTGRLVEDEDRENAAAAGINVTAYHRQNARAAQLDGLKVFSRDDGIKVDNAEVVAALKSLPKELAEQLRNSPLQVKAHALANTAPKPKPSDPNAKPQRQP